MNTITKEILQDWCSNYCNCYWVWINGKLMTTGECPPLCDQVAGMVERSEMMEEVTARAEEFCRQFVFEVEHNDNRLYMVQDGKWTVVVCYFGHKFEEEDDEDL